MPATELRPRSASELVDATFQVVRGHYLPMLVLSAIMGVPSLVVTLFASPVFANVRGQNPVTITLAGLCALAAGLWFVVVDGALVWYTGRIYLGEPADPATAIRAATARWGRLVVANVARGLYIVLGVVPVALVLAVFLPAFAGGAGARTNPGAAVLAGLVALVGVVFVFGWLLFALARYFPLAPVLIFEEHGALAALRRSAELMKGSKRRAALLSTLAFVIWIALSMLVTVPIGLLRHPSIVQAANVAVRLLLYPLFATLVTLLYYDQRVRKEAFDIEHMSTSLGGSPSAFGAMPADATGAPGAA